MASSSAKKIKKPQLRRCGLCQNVGHNKATCPNKITTAAAPEVAPPKSTGTLNFFIHHVNAEPPSSPHVVNLKGPTEDVWHKVEAVSPEKIEPTEKPVILPLHKERITIDTSSQKKKPVKALPKVEEKNTEPEIPDILLRKKLFDESVLRRSTLLYQAKQKEQSKPKPVEQKKIEEYVAPTTWVKTTTPPEPISNPENWVKPASVSFKPKMAAVSKKTKKTALAIFSILIASGAMLVLPGTVKSYYQSVSAMKTTVTENSTAGFMALLESSTAIKSANIPGAETATNEALDNFDKALSTLETNHTVLQNIMSYIPILGGELASREKILLSGQEIAIGNSYLLSAVKNIEARPELSLTDKLSLLFSALESANPNYQQAAGNLNDVDMTSLPVEYQAQFKDFRTLFLSLTKDFKSITDLNEPVQEIFGGKGTRRYLLIFQNPAEIRATGGFMGSFAILDVNQGKIEKLDVPPGGTYDLNGQLKDYLIPPLPLTLSNKRWEFQDANWFPDFRASAQKILWFYNRSWNAKADGVIAVNATVLEKILALVGPITDDSRGISLSEGNALSTIQTVVEEGPDKKQNKPKQIISDLTPKLLTQLQNIPVGSLLPLLNNFKEALSQKEIQAYFVAPDAEQTVTDLGWSGSIANIDDKTDYLMVVNTNVQGQKSDARIHQTISHQAVVDEEGNITDTVLITREHQGEDGQKFYGQVNMDYLRLYAPEGSTLISAKGFTWPDERSFRAPESWYSIDPFLLENEKQISIDDSSGTRITNEFGKTAFGNWVATRPGETTKVEFTYRLPFKIDTKKSPQNIIEKTLTAWSAPPAKYQLIVQKQSGITSDFESQVIFPTSWSPSWTNGDSIVPASNGVQITKLPLTHDELWGILMKQVTH